MCVCAGSKFPGGASSCRVTLSICGNSVCQCSLSRHTKSTAGNGWHFHSTGRAELKELKELSRESPVLLPPALSSGSTRPGRHTLTLPVTAHEHPSTSTSTTRRLTKSLLFSNRYSSRCLLELLLTQSLLTKPPTFRPHAVHDNHNTIQ